MPQTMNGTYGIRALEVYASSTKLSVLWLKDLKGSQDLLIPILGDSQSLNFGKLYTESQLVSSLNC